MTDCILLPWVGKLKRKKTPNLNHQWPGRLGFNPRSNNTKDSKMVLDASLLNTQHYNVWIKGKVEQSKERSSAFLYASILWISKREPLGHHRLRSPNLLTYSAKSDLVSHPACGGGFQQVYTLIQELSSTYFLP